MSRTLWFAAGAGATLYAVNRARRVREAFTPDGLRDRVNGLALGARLFREEVEQGRLEKETELRERFGLVPHGIPELEAPASSRSQNGLLDQRVIDQPFVEEGAR
jgi:hypothetical protein